MAGGYLFFEARLGARTGNLAPLPGYPPVPRVPVHRRAARAAAAELTKKNDSSRSHGPGRFRRSFLLPAAAAAHVAQAHNARQPKRKPGSLARTLQGKLPHTLPDGAQDEPGRHNAARRRAAPWRLRLRRAATPTDEVASHAVPGAADKGKRHVAEMNPHATTLSASEAVEHGEHRDPVRVLVVDGEDHFRVSLAQRLALRGCTVDMAADGEAALRLVRLHRPDVVVRDRKMPNLSGEEVLRELKDTGPEVQVVMLSGHGSLASATGSGRLDALAYLQKPCTTDELVKANEAAAREKSYAMARHQMPQVRDRSVRAWLVGTHNWRPGVMLLGVFLSDGATVSAVGPIAVRMASVSGTHPWMVGFATASASSFANCFINGTPGNAFAFSLAKDAHTGEQLVALRDFLVHDIPAPLLALACLWGWTVLGCWRWIGF